MAFVITREQWPTVGLILGLAAAMVVVAYLMYRQTSGSGNGKKTAEARAVGQTSVRTPSRIDLGPAPPKPVAPPQGNVFATIGNWPVPVAVRYAVQYRGHNGRTGPLSDWTRGWYESNYYSNNILKQFPFVSANPQSPNSPASILLWRQFRGQKPKVVAELPYPYKGHYVDMAPNVGQGG